MANRNPSLALIVGSGFSVEADLPTTPELGSRFLSTLPDTAISAKLEQHITSALRHYWREVFHGEGPSLEDHFTLLDLAANSGHHLGCSHSPRKLRAIRRISIHRVFQLLDLVYRPSNRLRRLFAVLRHHFNCSVVSLNWDIVAEKHLPDGVHYGIDVLPLRGDTFVRQGGTPLLKVHGSANWVYCDCCHCIFGGSDKSALHKKAFLEVDDFTVLGRGSGAAKAELERDDGRTCEKCGNRLAGRVATFSFRKAFSINQFQTVWDLAHQALRNADSWLFVGYSMPEADFEFRHLLKSAQLGRRSLADWSCEAVLRGDPSAEDRYRRFFGAGVKSVYQDGLAEWIDVHFDDFCRRRGAR